MVEETSLTRRQWRRKAIHRQWIIGMLERRIDLLEEELQQHQEGKKL